MSREDLDDVCAVLGDHDIHAGADDCEVRGVIWEITLISFM